MSVKPVKFPEHFERDVENRMFTRAIYFSGDSRVIRAFFEALPDGAPIQSFFRDSTMRQIARQHGYDAKKNRKLRKMILIKPHFKEHDVEQQYLFNPEMLGIDNVEHEHTEATDV